MAGGGCYEPQRGGTQGLSLVVVSDTTAAVGIHAATLLLEPLRQQVGHVGRKHFPHGPTNIQCETHTTTKRYNTMHRTVLKR